MRTCVLLLFMTSCLALLSQTSWLPLSSGSTKDLYAVSFPDAQNGFVAGAKGAILKTNNAGSTWSSIFSDTTQRFTSIHFTSPLTGYALSKHRLYGTQNGGTSWQILYSDTIDNLNVIYFLNNTTGFIGTGDKILKTVNAGLSWTNSYTTGQPISSICFTSPSIGYFTGGSNFSDLLFKTTDQGSSFSSYTLGLQSIKEKVYFLDASVGYLTGWYGPALSKTIDGGQTWNPINTANDTQGFDVYFSDEFNGYYIDNAGGISRIYRTSDGGNSWNVDASSTDYTFRKFVFTATGKAFAVGNNGGIYSTQLTTGLEEFTKESQINVYPNPSNGKITISSGTDLNACIVNALGQTIKTVALNAFNDHRCELSGLSAGVYFIRIEHQDRSHKVIVFE